MFTVFVPWAGFVRNQAILYETETVWTPRFVKRPLFRVSSSPQYFREQARLPTLNGDAEVIPQDFQLC